MTEIPTLRLGVDVYPTVGSILTATDYLEEAVSRLLYTRVSRTCIAIHWNADEVSVETVLPSGKDGTSFVAADAVSLLQHFLSDTNRPFFGIRSVEAMSVDRFRLQFGFRNPSFLQALLDDPVFSFYRADVESGPFYLSADEHLMPNLYHTDWQGFAANPFGIRLVPVSEAPSRKTLDLNRIDATCPSAFDAHGIPPTNYELIRWRLPLTMVLIRGDSELRFPTDLLRDAVSDIPGIDPKSTFWPWARSRMDHELDSSRARTRTREVALYFADFYPNRIATQRIADAVASTGIKLQPVAIPYRALIHLQPGADECKLSIIAATTKCPAVFYLKILSQSHKRGSRRASSLLYEYLMNDLDNVSELVESMELALRFHECLTPIGQMRSEQWVSRRWAESWRAIVHATGFGLMHEEAYE